MNIAEYDFDLPQELIAQTPLKKRDTSKLMVVSKKDQSITHKHFYDIVDYFKKGDVLVRNVSKVIPARLYGIKEESGARVEVLILKEEAGLYECLCGNARVIKLDTVISFGNKLKARCVQIKDEGIRVFEMIHEGIFLEILEELGTMPLPPYIHTKLEDKNRYQTIYAKDPGSSACPTAGLHFTDEIIEKLKAKGVEIYDIILHVGLGTFKPIKETEIEKHKMHYEAYEISDVVAKALNQAKQEKRRIISVGTTTTRTLETQMAKYGLFKAEKAETNIFIYPPYQFKAIDVQITNFHLPKSTLLLMISAFSSKELIFEAYKQAIENQYRFFSFGDCMLITNE